MLFTQEGGKCGWGKKRKRATLFSLSLVAPNSKIFAFSVSPTLSLMSPLRLLDMVPTKAQTRETYPPPNGGSRDLTNFWISKQKGKSIAPQI